MADLPPVTDEPGASQLQLRLDGHLAHIQYRREPGELVVVHTEVPNELEGRGIGGALVQAAVELADREGLTLRAECPFARGWLERHPDASSNWV